ncbi:MAG: hypothetical protein OXG78_12455 [Chloroflexi bacterium]|nr:hypothetical protein [Chloroflexota bacterium]
MSRESLQPDPGYRELERAQRRRIWLSVVLPFALVLIAVAVSIAIALSLRSPAQVSILSNSLMTLLVLCPSVIVMFPLVVLSIALVALLSRWPGRTRSPLRRMEAWTATLEENVEGWLGQFDGKVLDWLVRLAPVRQLLGAFDAPDEAITVEGNE